MSVSGIPAGVGWTALLTAYSRAQESRQARPLFEDRLAAAFVAAAGGTGTGSGAGLPRLGPASDDDSSPLWNVFRFYFTQRTPFYDRHITESVTSGIRQVVLLGAGLDSRAYRLGMPEDVTVFEIDQAPVHDFKDSVLARRRAIPACARVPVVADIGHDMTKPLLRAGFDPAVPAVWAAEGLLFYLSREAAGRLAAEITAVSAPGSRLAGEYFSRRWENSDVGYETLQAPDQQAWDLIMREFSDGPADAPAAWLAAHGWTAQEVTTLAETGRRTGRPVPVEFARPGAPEVWLFAAVLNSPLSC